MKYVVLIYSNPMSREIWAGLSSTQRAEGLAYYAGLNEALTESGELIITEALAGQDKAKRVRVHEGITTTTDGPFAEAKEHLAGLYLLDCESMDRAVEIASEIPEAEYGLVEVRPVMELSDFDV
ncbi:MAG TPA: YciI family protein [Polyangiaceae bacterium]|nr:YciI family protein [Polyangiaceae bacterium]